MPDPASFLTAVRSHDDAGARAALEADPGLALTSLCAAAAAGETQEVARRLGEGTAGDGWPALAYAAASPMHSDGLAQCARLLLDAGADPNTATATRGWDDLPGRWSVLYHAVVGRNRAVVRLLLERGAQPQDGEAIEWTLEYGLWDLLELLVSRGADVSRRSPRSGVTPLHFLLAYLEPHVWAGAPPYVLDCPDRVRAGLHALLMHGADPNVTSAPDEETPLHRVARNGYGATHAELLLRNGARPDARRSDERTPFALAVRTANDEVAGALRAAGADRSGVTAMDELLGACLRGDETTARRHAGLLPSSPDERSVLCRAVLEERPASLRLMKELGFDLGWETGLGSAASGSGGGHSGTALHHAAWNGKIEMVRMLLELGAPVDARDSTHHGTPLGWARHGADHRRRPPEDYAAVIAALEAAGG
jgi:ankyrin repeat protein